MMQASPTKDLLRWPLVQQLYTRIPVLYPDSGYPPLTKDARLVNAYAEMVPGTKGDYWVFKRLGVGPIAQATFGLPGGAYSYGVPGSNGSTIVLSVVGGVLYNGNVAVSGTFSTIPGVPCYFETINSNPQTIAIIPAYGSAGFIYTPATNTVAGITNTTFLGINRVPGLAYLDGWFFVMDTSGTIWNTQNTDNVAVWNALNTVRASSQADQGVFLSKQLNYIVAFKQWTTQIFYDASAQISGQGTPLGAVPDSQVPYGCLHPFTVQKIDEILLWATSNHTISPQIILMQNLTPTIVSTPSVDGVLDNFSAITAYISGSPFYYNPGIYSWVLKHAGHRFYGLTIPLLNVTLVFDIDQKLWYVWSDSNGNYWPFGYFTYEGVNLNVGAEGIHLAQCLPSPTPYQLPFNLGSLYPIDGDYDFPTDGGNIFPVDIYTPSTDFGTLREKQLNMMYFEADQVLGSKMFARYTDDDGSFTKRAYNFRHAAACPFRIRSSGLDIDIGIL